MTRSVEAGFSLVEILIVLAIIGVLSGVTVISLGAVDRGARPETEAKLFAGRLSLALDEALVTGRPLSLAIDADGYSIEVNDGKDWKPHPNRLLGDRHDLARGMRLETAGNVERVALMPDASGAPLSVVFSGATGAWLVEEDGLSARAAPIAR